MGRLAMGTRIGMRGPFDLPPLARVRCRLPRGRYRLRSNALRGLARIHWWRHSWLILICGSAVFCQIEVVQNGVSIQSEKAAGFSPVERKDPPPLLFGFYPIRAWVRLYDSPSNLIILP